MRKFVWFSIYIMPLIFLLMIIVTGFLHLIWLMILLSAVIIVYGHINYYFATID